jgi:hypothetical protein
VLRFDVDLKYQYKFSTGRKSVYAYTYTRTRYTRFGYHAIHIYCGCYIHITTLYIGSYTDEKGLVAQLKWGLFKWDLLQDYEELGKILSWDPRYMSWGEFGTSHMVI